MHAVRPCDIKDGCKMIRIEKDIEYDEDTFSPSPKGSNPPTHIRIYICACILTKRREEGLDACVYVTGRGGRKGGKERGRAWCDY